MLKWTVTNHRMDYVLDVNSCERRTLSEMWSERGYLTDISDGDSPPLVVKKPKGKGSAGGFVTIEEDLLQFASFERGFLPHLSPKAPPALRTAVCKTLRRLNCLESSLVECSSEAIRKNVETEINVCRRRLEVLDSLFTDLKEVNVKCHEHQFLKSPSLPDSRKRRRHDTLSKMSGHGRVVFLDSKGAARARKRADDYFSLPDRPQIKPEDKVIIRTNEGIISTHQPSEIRVERPARRSASNSGTVQRPRNTVLISVGPSETGVQTRVNIHLIDPEHATSHSEQSEYLSEVRSANPPRGIQRAQSYQGDLNSVGKLTRCASYGDSINLAGGLKERAPSVEEILDNIRKMSKEKTVKDKKRKAPQPGSLLGIKYNNPKPEPIYSPVDVRSSPKLSDGVYQNLQESYYENMENWYDCPKSPSGEKTYANLVNEVESEYENINYGERIYSNATAEYCNVETLKKRAKQKPSPMYDVPKSAIHIYDSPQKNIKYDKPMRNDERVGGDCDSDSLESEAGVLEEPDIPPPDYGNVNEEYFDEGIGESDSRSYYTEDQGLEVIPEEPEEEEEEERHFNLKHQRQDCIPMSAADEVTRDCVRTAVSNTSLGSLGGSESEGIGSAAEGEFHSSGESTHGEENEPKVELEKDSSPAYTGKVETSSDEKTEADRCVEVYNETVRQRTSSKSPRTSICESPAKDYAGTDTLRRMRKFLPSVRALRNQFEVKKDENSSGISDGSSTRSSSPSAKSRSRRSSMESNFSTSSVSSKRSTASTDTCRTDDSSTFSRIPDKRDTEIPSVESIIKQFANMNPEKILYRSASSSWDPSQLVNALYTLPAPSQSSNKAVSYINIEGYLEKLPSGRKKATFWNAWKKRYFRVEDGYLYYYQSSQNEKPNFKIQLMGGDVQIGENNMIGIDDGKGHYIAVRCSSEEDLEKWRTALLTQVQENFNAAWTYPSPLPLSPTLFKDILILDLGSCSVRAGVLTSQATLPQLFYPAVTAKNKSNENIAYGYDALKPQIRATSSLKYPFRTTTGVNKYAVDMTSVTGFLSQVFRQLNVDPSRYHIQLSLPRALPPTAQVELLKILFDQFGVRGVNLTNHSVLALGAYSASSGIVVDIGERMDIVPIMDGYMLDSGVSRVPYGGHEIAEHVRHFLLQKNYSLVSEAETFIVRLVLERLCYVSGPSPTAYHNDLALGQKDPLSVQASLNLEQYRGEHVPWGEIVLDSGRFQVPEGLFHPDAWGLDHPGVQKLVCRAIQECGVDIRKEMSRSIYLAGGVTMLPGFAERLEEEVNRLTPPGISPKVHASPYRYHAAYLGACVLANSPAFEQLRITREDWQSLGPNSVRKWKV